MKQKRSTIICAHCHSEHPTDMKYCPTTGKAIYVSCPNPTCVNHGKDVLPRNTAYCPQCGTQLSSQNLSTQKKVSTSCSGKALKICITIAAVLFLISLMAKCS